MPRPRPKATASAAAGVVDALPSWKPAVHGSDDGVQFRVRDLAEEARTKAKAERLAAKKGFQRSPRTTKPKSDLPGGPSGVDPFLVLANRQPMTQGRRTSFALGPDIHQKTQEFSRGARAAWAGTDSGPMAPTRTGPRREPCGSRHAFHATNSLFHAPRSKSNLTWNKLAAGQGFAERRIQTKIMRSASMRSRTAVAAGARPTAAMSPGGSGSRAQYH